MRRILEEFYYGNLNPCDQQFLRVTDYANAMRTVSENEEKLTLLLDEKEKDLLRALIQAQGTVNETTAMENFIRGFRIGGRIAMEIMEEDDGCLRSIT